MLPAPARIGAPPPRSEPAHQDRELADGGYRERQNDLQRDLGRDLPRERLPEPPRDILRNPPQRDVVREALGQDAGFQAEQPVTREISRDALRDLGRDLDRREEQRQTRDRQRFEPAPAIRNDDFAFEEPPRDNANARPRSAGTSGRRDDGGQQKKGASAGLWIGGAAVFALIAGGAYIADQMREQIVQVVPGTARVYDAIGMKVNARGLDFTDITYAKEIQNGVTVLAIRGAIVNVSDREVPIPKLHFTVRNEDQQPIYNWTLPVEIAKLPPKGRTAFATKLESPPPDAWDLKIRFAKAGE